MYSSSDKNHPLNWSRYTAGISGFSVSSNGMNLYQLHR
jgi:hypothetical protein